MFARLLFHELFPVASNNSKEENNSYKSRRFLTKMRRNRRNGKWEINDQIMHVKRKDFG